MPLSVYHLLGANLSHREPIMNDSNLPVPQRYTRFAFAGSE